VASLMLAVVTVGLCTWPGSDTHSVGAKVSYLLLLVLR
jgi:hypothetical protein